jgi:uncharacterized phage protein (TIGR01671 family)
MNKFRIWDKKLEEMNYMTLKDLADGDTIFFDGETPMWTVFDDVEKESKRFVLMWDTGLKDKNKVKIFEDDKIKTREGDIAIVKFGEYEEPCSGGVKYGYYLEFQNIFNSRIYVKSIIHWLNGCEVIGNIREVKK